VMMSVYTTSSSNLSGVREFRQAISFVSQLAPLCERIPAVLMGLRAESAETRHLAFRRSLRELSMESNNF
jgi:hypothetical protein